MTKANIVPGFAHVSLISKATLCNSGYHELFDMEECQVYYKNYLVPTGGRDPITELWRLPIKPTDLCPEQ